MHEDPHCTAAYVDKLQHVAAYMDEHHAGAYKVFVLYPPRASAAALEANFGDEKLQLCVGADGFDRPPGAGVFAMADLLLICARMQVRWNAAFFNISVI